MDLRLAANEATDGHPDEPLADLRFRKLLPKADWETLPPAVRTRFTKRLADGATTSYVGRVTEMTMSRAGYLLAQLARLIGAPLPLSREVGNTCIVALTEDRSHGGQIWTRLYARSCGFPQVIHSAKRFEGPTGLEEHVGRGVGMSLRVSVDGDGSLAFRSSRYFVAIGRRRICLPRWLCPGDLTVTHREIDATRFLFTLDIEHRWLGRLIHQHAEFHEVRA